MNQDTAPVSCEVIAAIVVELERLMNDACDRWTLPKRYSERNSGIWHARELAYWDALKLLADAGLAPPKYATRR